MRLALNVPAPSPLASSRLSHPSGASLTLGVLGASHVIAVEDATFPFSEEVSCTARSEAVLPARAHAPGYRLESHTEMHNDANFRKLAHVLRDRCAQEHGWLGGAFPGDDAALTALAAAPDGAGWCWQTWHLYPDTDGGGSVVYTSSRWRR